MRHVGMALFFAAVLWAGAPAYSADPLLQQSIASPERSSKFAERDHERHPAGTLEFFGLRPDMTIVEIFPGGGYWTEILAPYLRENGKLYVAGPVAGSSKYADKSLAYLDEKLKAKPALYDRVIVTSLGEKSGEIAPAGSADMVVTFRNLHNWMEGGYADAAFAAFYKALKPGGILGIEEHRARTDKPQDPAAKSGYVREDYTIALAKKAGFDFVASSEINANPKDTADWPKGVWTLPPTLALGDVDRAKYEAIGEADNFVLKFRKPE